MRVDRIPDGEGVDAHARVSSAWRSHVPDFVIEFVRDQRGAISLARDEPHAAVVLFADVAGFTPLSESLARSGSHGTERLTAILNRWFAAMSERITRHGGSVADFAGDALIGVFDRRGARGAVQCALGMQADTARLQLPAAGTGPFRLAMKVGLAAGPLLQTVMGDPDVRLGYVLAGPALDRAQAAEHHAREAEVVVHDGLRDDLDGADVADRDGRWLLVRGLGDAAAAGRPGGRAPLDGAATGRLAPFLHPAVADRLSSGRRELVNEHREVTAAFVGLPRAAVDDRVAVAALQRFLAAAVRLVADYGGHFRHLAADDRGHVLVAFFGAPVSHEDDAERAVRCCLELLRLPGGPYRAGLATGAVFCGEVGTAARREYAVIGDPANLAARLLHRARDGQVLVDRTTHDRIRHLTAHDRLGPIAVKGRSGRIGVWAVRAVRERPVAGPAVPRTAQPMVGRAAEVTGARELVARVLDGAGQVLCLVGEAGIGKSRLAAEVVEVARKRGFAVFGGASRSYATTTSYLVWRSVWRDALGLDPAASVADQQAVLTERIARHTADAGDRVALLAPVLNVPLPDSAFVAPLDPQIRAGLLRSLLLDCLRDLASSAPVVLVLEDCHWIDPASASLLAFLASNIGDLRVLVVVTSREPATVPPLAALAPLAHVTEFRLAELDRPEAVRLVGLRLRERFPASGPADPAVVERIAEQGEGNPFYLGEIVNFLYAEGTGAPGRHDLATLELPDGLQRLLMARLDQLSEGEQATIKVASVIGRRFRASWISRTYPAAGAPEDVARHLARLHELDLTPRRAAVGDGEYEFKHAMTQEAAYQSLTFGMRETLHERLGELIETTLPEQVDQYVDLLAHHYGRTQRADKQRVWFRAAGDAAKAAFANDAAVGYYDRLLPLLPTHETGDVLVELGGVWQLTGRWGEAERAYREALEVASAAQRPAVVAAAERDLGDLYTYNRSYAEAVTWLRRAVDGFERLGDDAGLCRALDRLTFALVQQSAYDEALTTAERHRTLASGLGDLAAVSIAINHTAAVHLQCRRLDEARRLFRLALDTANRTADRRCQLHAATNLALACSWSGEHLAALTYGRQAFEVAREIGSRQAAGLAIGNMGETYRDEGDLARATRCCAYALRIAVELRDWISIADQLAVAASAAGQRGDAVRLLERAVALARHLDAPHLLCGWLHQTATLHAEQGRFAAADELNREALAVAVAHDERDVQVRASVLAEQLQVALGRKRAEEAVASLRRQTGVWTQPHERALILATLWRIDPDDEQARSGAAELYRDLHAQTPNVAYREAFAFLTGTSLPPGPPLPPLPEELEDGAADLAALLVQVDRVVGELTAAGSARPEGDRLAAPEPA
jgi:predicted ATPase/class 3 adenylate cyclase